MSAEARYNATDCYRLSSVVCLCVCLSVCLSVGHAKTAEAIEMSIGG